MAWPLPKWNACSSEATIRALSAGSRDQPVDDDLEATAGLLVERIESHDLSADEHAMEPGALEAAANFAPRQSLRRSSRRKTGGSSRPPAVGETPSQDCRARSRARSRGNEVAPPWRTAVSSGRGARSWSRPWSARSPRDGAGRSRSPAGCRGSSRRAACSCDRETAGRTRKTSRRSGAGPRRRGRRTPSSTCPSPRRR